VLRDRFYDADTVVGIATDHRRAGLDPADVAVNGLRRQGRRGRGLGDRGRCAALRGVRAVGHRHLDVALAAAARCFFSTVLDAMGTEPDAAYRTSLSRALREALAVGRPIAEGSG